MQLALWENGHAELLLDLGLGACALEELSPFMHSVKPISL